MLEPSVTPLISRYCLCSSQCWRLVIRKNPSKTCLYIGHPVLIPAHNPTRSDCSSFYARYVGPPFRVCRGCSGGAPRPHLLHIPFYPPVSSQQCAPPRLEVHSLFDLAGGVMARSDGLEISRSIELFIGGLDYILTTTGGVSAPTLIYSRSSCLNSRIF